MADRIVTQRIAAVYVGAGMHGAVVQKAVGKMLFTLNKQKWQAAKRTAFFWVVTQRVLVIRFFLDYLPLKMAPIGSAEK